MKKSIGLMLGFILTSWALSPSQAYCKENSAPNQGLDVSVTTGPGVNANGSVGGTLAVKAHYDATEHSVAYSYDPASLQLMCAFCLDPTAQGRLDPNFTQGRADRAELDLKLGMANGFLWGKEKRFSNGTQADLAPLGLTAVDNRGIDYTQAGVTLGLFSFSGSHSDKLSVEQDKSVPFDIHGNIQVLKGIFGYNNIRGNKNGIGGHALSASIGVRAGLSELGAGQIGDVTADFGFDFQFDPLYRWYLQLGLEKIAGNDLLNFSFQHVTDKANGPNKASDLQLDSNYLIWSMSLDGTGQRSPAVDPDPGVTKPVNTAQTAPPTQVSSGSARR